ncbi:MAG TPA: hypothetical protein DIT04_04930 [Dysgonomonas sp.]|nr:hypothetical protein [Dysgonomonas sp.]
MDCKQIYLCIFLSLLAISLKAQGIPEELKSSINEEKKKNWLNNARSGSKTYGSPRQYIERGSSKAIVGKDYTGLDKIYGNGIDWSAFDDKYQVNPAVYTYSSKVPINQLPPGYVIPMFIGGRFVWANPNTRVDQLVIPSGINLSGGGKKPMSEKAKNILKYVFGMEVEED